VVKTRVSVRVDTRLLDKIIRQLPGALEDVLDVAAFNVEKKAKFRVPVDTGATKNSIAVSKPSRHSRSIGPSTSYAPPLEFGTARISARPFMIPALESEKRLFIRAVEAMTRRVV